MFLIPQHLRIFQHIEQHQHGGHRILDDGTRIWYLECCYCITPVLDRRPRPSYPRHSFWMCLQPFLLDFNQPHPMPPVWQSIIWMFHSRTKFSFHPAAVFSRWRLWEWFQWRLTNTFTQNAMYTPCIQHRTCILQPCTHHSMQTSHNSQQSYGDTYQTSAPPSILQWWPKSQHLPSIHGHFQ